MSAAGKILALDLGSSGVRAVVYDERAEPVPDARARRPLEPEQDDDGRAELDPKAYLDGLVACVDELSDAGALDGVSRVAGASQWHSVLALGPDREPRSAVLTWLDTRAHAVEPRLPADADAFHERTGTWVHPLYWTTKVPFLRTLDDLTGARFVGLPDYVLGVLLGDVTTSVSVASGTGLLDLAKMRWDDEALALAGLSAAEVPEIDDTPRQLAEPWRSRWPALADAEWHAVLGDGAASNLGSGCATDDAVAVTVGTSAALRVVHGPDAPSPPPTVWRYRVDASRLVSGIAFSGGGVLRAWAVRMLGLESDAEPSRPPGTSGLVSVPLHAGSRPPGTAPPGSGLVAGFSLDTSADEFLAATLEGVALEAARALEVLELDLFELASGARLDVVLGGGAVHASAWFRRALAATFDRPVRLAGDPEVGARGAAAWAGGFDLDRPTETVEPTHEDVVRMAALRTRYSKWREVVHERAL
ncbi:FGGY family carbohydrate kinase [Actinopolymorpha sp. B11F2]|uniref:FGGY family carbohydrate kinase n=1 Tax=Actinopolymorpha sp. B11F2 TaxID=3160862 RepID=UPI0032E43C82